MALEYVYKLRDYTNPHIACNVTRLLTVESETLVDLGVSRIRHKLNESRILPFVKALLLRAGAALGTVRCKTNASMGRQVTCNGGTRKQIGYRSKGRRE